MGGSGIPDPARKAHYCSDLQTRGKFAGIYASETSSAGAVSRPASNRTIATPSCAAPAGPVPLRLPDRDTRDEAGRVDHGLRMNPVDLAQDPDALPPSSDDRGFLAFSPWGGR